MAPCLVEIGGSVQHGDAAGLINTQVSSALNCGVLSEQPRYVVCHTRSQQQSGVLLWVVMQY